jgi:tight adherence protein C
LGLSEDELLSACLLFGASLFGASVVLCDAFTLPPALSLGALLLGTFVPWVRVLGVARERGKSVDRALPNAVELAAMCMSAGLDFPGSLRQVVESSADPDQPLIEEFTRVLRELDLGHTRRSALDGFAGRVPTTAVREFVSSVAQAEDKGTPLANILTIQAQTQRLRRSLAAEQTASAAALMLLGPMTLIFLCVIVLLLGPVVVRFATGSLGPP